jgi:hypothetical protein
LLVFLANSIFGRTGSVDYRLFGLDLGEDCTSSGSMTLRRHRNLSIEDVPPAESKLFFEFESLCYCLFESAIDPSADVRKMPNTKLARQLSQSITACG